MLEVGLGQVNTPTNYSCNWKISSTGQPASAAPQSNGFVERLHRTLLDEHFRIQGRRNWYESLDEMQSDLNAYLHHYNHKRAHQGRNMNGRTPYQAFLDSLPEG
ncbi:hypothetical protein DDE01_03300 [Desulfovibrio desulfuricans]|nr:hypothetical protein DDE01_03300 [Desulfovibrio desulfuricans]